jgi:ketosteroid isomerase-like protein
MLTKYMIFCAILLLICFGCATKESGQLTQEQKDQIKSEAKAVEDSLIERFEKLDAEGILQYYADTPEWRVVYADGARYDYQTFKKGIVDFCNAAASWKWTTIRRDFIVITKDIILCPLDGKDETVMKSGDRITYDPRAYTVIFKKITGQWKVIYQQDSGIPVTQKAAKK